MNRKLSGILCVLAILFAQGAPAFGQEKVVPTDATNELKKEIQELRELIKEERKAHEAQLKVMQKRLDGISSEILKKDMLTKEAELKIEIEKSVAESQGSETRNLLSSAGRALQSLNPDISVIIDTYYHNSDASDEIGDITEGMAGFGHPHEHGHGHEHSVLEEGFNLRHLELYFSGEVDPYFKAYAIAAVSEDDAEIEEAVIQTTCLPAGFQLQAGKFFSHFGRINQQHSHEWDFIDQPLIHNLTLGAHGLNEKGLQLSWLAPTPFHLLAGLEAYQGDNELLFNHIGGDALPDKDGPRLWVGWLKFSPDLPQEHGLQIGVFGSNGTHQEAHDGNSDGTNDHWLDGRGTFWGVDFVYKYGPGLEHGMGDFTLQGEYLWRKKDLSVDKHELNPALVGEDRIDKQDGYYIQAVYGLLPRWRAALRLDQVGLTNKSEFPDGTSASYDDSYRLAGMVDFSPTEFSLIRLQVNKGEYQLSDEDKDVWEIFAQVMISLGTHGAHKF
ncbi:MAG: porin [Thermodesulfobacteriota bacterium]|nr:porin [Thermodesulfobacteriota bacterium]